MSMIYLSAIYKKFNICKTRLNIGCIINEADLISLKSTHLLTLPLTNNKTDHRPKHHLFTITYEYEHLTV